MYIFNALAFVQQHLDKLHMNSRAISKCYSTLITISLLAIILTPAFAQYKSAYTTVKSVDLVEVKADGGYSQIMERLYSVDTKQGISGMGELRIDFNEKLEEVEVLEAYTLLPDGTRMDVPADKIKRQDGDGREEYSDGKVWVIIFPGNPPLLQGS